jgi:prophage antirepressor-like protein
MLKSKMKKAKLFADWITNDVLPSIRKYGYYKMKNKRIGKVPILLFYNQEKSLSFLLIDKIL